MTSPWKLLIAALHVWAASVGAQDVPRTTLSTPTGEMPDEFSKVVAAQELGPGRLLVFDEMERQLVILDFSARRSKTVGGVGAGPGEFRSVGSLIARPGGGAFVTDFALSRLLPILPDGRTAETIAFPPGYLHLKSSDSMGRIYGGVMTYNSEHRLQDSMFIVRWDTRRATVDTLLKYDAGRSSMVTRRGDPRYVWRNTATWTVLPNGTIAMLEANAYRLSLWKEGGRIATATIPYAHVEITEAAKSAWTARQRANPPRMMGGGTGTPVPPAAAPPFLSGGVIFPATYPAFDADAQLLLSADGALWIERLRSPLDSVPSYDVISLDGKLAGRVQLPPRSTLIAMGSGTLYLAVKDDNDVSRIRRYSYPSVGRR